MIELGTFNRIITYIIVKIDDLSLLIIRYKKYILKNIIYKKKGNFIKDLIFLNIIIIKGFYINIILKTRLLKKIRI